MRDAARVDAIDAAAAAGFGAVGMRFDLAPPSRSELNRLRARLDDCGLAVLDVEVVRLSAHWNQELEKRLVEWASAIRARHLLVVSDDPDRARTIDGLQRVARRCDEAGLSAVLEFMRFTYPSRLEDAIALAREVDPPLAGVLVDALHLERSGGRPEAIGAFDAAMFPYVQICDAAGAIDVDDLDALAFEARHARLAPGAGALPLAALLEQFPVTTPISVEVQSGILERDSPPARRAVELMTATRELFESTRELAGRRPRDGFA